jgi:primosomal protein N' (replication factor Y)
MTDARKLTPKTVRIIPDLPAVAKEFDYLVPDTWASNGIAERLRIGSMVRIQLGRRSIGGWVSELDPDTDPTIELQPLRKVSSVGPSKEVVDLARWAANRWYGPISRLLRTSSPTRMIKIVPPARPSKFTEMPKKKIVVDAYRSTPAVVRVPPTGDRWPFVLGAVSLGNALILLPSVSEVQTVTNRLKRLGIHVGSYNKDWGVGPSSGTIVGNRSAAFATVKDLAAILMIDEHDEAYQEQTSPTWHAREVLLERARRNGTPCVFVSPIPTPEIRHEAVTLAYPRDEEQKEWSKIEVTDPREDGSAMGGLWPSSTVSELRSANRAVVILNRTGRSRLLACRACEELAVCTDCGGAMHQPNESILECTRFRHTRPVVCSFCLSTSMKNLRLGVTRAVEELQALLNEPVTEVTKENEMVDFLKSRIFLGTEAALHRIDWADLVLFADFDQELLAKRYRCEEQAMAQLILAQRLVGSHNRVAGKVIVQSRQPNHSLFGFISAGDIDTWSSIESRRRQLLEYPPYGHIALISGEGAEEFIGDLRGKTNLQILGPNEGAWLIRASKSEELAGALSKIQRPKARLRVAIDPSRF